MPPLPGFSLNPIDWFTDAAGSIVDGAANAAFEFFVEKVMEALDWLARQIASLFIDAGRPVFGEGSSSTSSLMVFVALVVVIGTAMIQVGVTAVRPNASSSSALVDLPVTVLALSSVYAIASVWLSFTDSLADATLSDTVRQSFSAGMQLDTSIVPFMRLLMGLLMVVFMFLLFLEQLVRAHSLGLVIVLLPVAVASRVWEPARYIAVAMVKIFIALSITPIVAGVSMSLALANFNSSGPFDFVRMLGAIAGMAVTALTPFVVFKLFPIGADGGGGAGLAAVGGTVAAGSMASGAMGMFGSASRDASSAAGAGAAGMGAAAAGPIGAAGAAASAAGRGAAGAAGGVADATGPSTGSSTPQMAGAAAASSAGGSAGSGSTAGSATGGAAARAAGSAAGSGSGESRSTQIDDLVSEGSDQ